MRRGPKRTKLSVRGGRLAGNGLFCACGCRRPELMRYLLAGRIGDGSTTGLMLSAIQPYTPACQRFFKRGRIIDAIEARSRLPGGV